MQRGLITPVKLAAVPIACILVTATALVQPACSQQKDPSLLRIGVFTSSANVTDVVPAQRLISRMHWGAKDSSGLQLGTYYDPHIHGFRCFIRNEGARAVTMNSYQIGCGGYIKVYARIAGTTQWTVVSDGTCAHGAGPSAKDNVKVQPGQYLVRENLLFDGDAKHRTVTQTECSFTAFGALTRLPNPDLKPVEFRVEHSLPNDGSQDVWQGVLSSAVLTVPTKLLAPRTADAPASRP